MRLCVYMCACACARACMHPADERNKSAIVGLGFGAEMRGTALNPTKSLTRPSISVNASCVLSALAFFRRSFDVHRSQLISGARRPCIMMSRARAVFSRYTCEPLPLSRFVLFSTVISIPLQREDMIYRLFRSPAGGETALYEQVRTF